MHSVPDNCLLFTGTQLAAILSRAREQAVGLLRQRILAGDPNLEADSSPCTRVPLSRRRKPKSSADAVPLRREPLAAAQQFVSVSTDSDFERLLNDFPDASVVILRPCDYPTEIAADVLRRNAIRIAALPHSQGRFLALDRQLNPPAA